MYLKYPSFVGGYLFIYLNGDIDIENPGGGAGWYFLVACNAEMIGIITFRNSEDRCVNKQTVPMEWMG